VTRWPSAGGGGANWSPGLLDRAETFGESAVTLTHDLTQVSNGTLEIHPTGVGTFGTPDYDEDTTNDRGFSFEPNRDLRGVQATLHSDLPTGMTAYLRDGNGSILDSKTVDGGETVRFEHDLASGTGYQLTADKGGESYNATRGIDEPSTHALDVTGAVKDSGSYDYEYNFYSVKGFAYLEGSAIIEWPMPDDVAAWDIAPYQATTDGGTVEVYGVDPSDESRVTAALEDPGDISGVSNTTNLAFEVVLSRDSGDQQPQLDAIFRRRKIT